MRLERGAGVRRSWLRANGGERPYSNQIGEAQAC